MTYFFDCTETVGDKTVHHRGRVYNVVDKDGNHKWYSVQQTTTLAGEVVANSCFSDYFQGKFLDIPQSDLDRALVRKIK